MLWDCQQQHASWSKCSKKIVEYDLISINMLNDIKGSNPVVGFSLDHGFCIQLSE